MIDIKNTRELEIMRQGGRKLGFILRQLMDMSRPGIVQGEIESKARELIKQAGGVPSFMTVEGYKWATCICVNEEVVHGIPTDEALEEGDVLTVDVGMIYQGFHTDTAWTKVITSDPASVFAGKSAFLKAGEKALNEAILQAKEGNRVGHISAAIQKRIESSGYRVIKTLIGHGVGRQLHEEPQIPGMLKTDLGKTPLLTAGMTLAIEVIYAMGNGVVQYDSDDGWTIAMKDGSLSAVFEHTVAVTSQGPEILTLAT
jgi:methionyl aminopeptidase